MWVFFHEKMRMFGEAGCEVSFKILPSPSTAMDAALKHAREQNDGSMVE